MSDPAPPSGPSANRSFSPQDWSLRVKLAIALLVPSLIAVVLGGLRVADQAGEAAEFDRIAQVAATQAEVSKLVKRLQEERLRTTEFIVAGRTGDTAALQSSFGEVDAEQAAIRPIVQAAYPNDPAVVGAHRQAEQALALLPQLRDLVLKSDSPATTAVARYSEVIEQVLPLDAALLRGVNSTEVNGLSNALSGLSSARNEATLQQATIAAATSAREPTGGELAGLLASEARLVTSLNNYRTALDTAQRVRFAELIAGPANTDRSRLVDELTAADPARPLPGGTAVRASKVYGDFLAELDAADTGIRDELASTTQAARSTSVNLAVINVAVLLAALVIGAIIVGLITRAIISSLRTLRGAALEVAQKSLPDAVARMRGGTVPDVNVTPVPVHTREEVGEVARAFDAVHAQAVRLAAEQATLQNTVNSMFVNLSRRSQSLVDRQLQLIEELESNEQDPDQLASLFRLDHLATRMRRNSENLLVLAGTDLAKRSTHHVPIVDVLQAAVSEVEQYERVTVEQPPAVTVLGRAANDLQHLLSELLDNATSFSPPETQVTMSTSRAGNGPLVVEIIDRGIGMRPDELEDINRRFADADDSRMTASRRMGLFVVGRLAARHGVQVRLIAGAPTPGPTPADTGPVATVKGTGVTARVTIPAHLVTSGTGGARRPDQGGRSALAPSRPAGQPSIMVPPQRAGSDRLRLPAAPEGPPAQVQNGSGPGTDQETPPAGPTAIPMPALGGSGLAKRTRPGADPEASDEDAAAAVADEADPATPGNGNGQVNGSGPGGHDSKPRVIASPLWPTERDARGAAPAAETAESIAAPELFGPSPVLDMDDTPTTRTPIFEEVASGWFRAYRQVPINWQPDLDGVVPDDIDHSQPIRPVAAPPPPAAAADARPVAPITPATPAAPVPSVAQSWPPPRPVPVPDDFASAADEGWRAAVEARREPVPMDVVPGTDLPRRTPGAQLLPGGIASGPPAGSSRDAAAIRSRLSNYQRGVRSGRTDRTREPGEGSAAEAGPAEARSAWADPGAGSPGDPGAAAPRAHAPGPDAGRPADAATGRADAYPARSGPRRPGGRGGPGPDGPRSDDGRTAAGAESASAGVEATGSGRARGDAFGARAGASGTGGFDAGEFGAGGFGAGRFGDGGPADAGARGQAAGPSTAGQGGPDQAGPGQGGPDQGGPDQGGAGQGGAGQGPAGRPAASQGAAHRGAVSPGAGRSGPAAADQAAAGRATSGLATPDQAAAGPATSGQAGAGPATPRQAAAGQQSAGSDAAGSAAAGPGAGAPAAAGPGAGGPGAAGPGAAGPGAGGLEAAGPEAAGPGVAGSGVAGSAAVGPGAGGQGAGGQGAGGQGAGGPGGGRATGSGGPDSGGFAQDGSGASGNGIGAAGTGEPGTDQPAPTRPAGLARRVRGSLDPFSTAPNRHTAATGKAARTGVPSSRPAESTGPETGTGGTAGAGQPPRPRSGTGPQAADRHQDSGSTSRSGPPDVGRSGWSTPDTPWPGETGAAAPATGPAAAADPPAAARRTGSTGRHELISRPAAPPSPATGTRRDPEPGTTGAPERDRGTDRDAEEPGPRDPA